MSANTPEKNDLIATLKSQLRNKSAVKESPFCNELISMRLQGSTYNQLSEFTASKGVRIPITTIRRDLMNVVKPQLTMTEEAMERWGGELTINTKRELSLQIRMQKLRIDDMHREEKKRQKEKNNPYYLIPEIKGEVLVLNTLLAHLTTIEHRERELSVEEAKKPINVSEYTLKMTEDGRAVFREMFLTGEVALVPTDMSRIDEPEVKAHIQRELDLFVK